MADSNQLPVLTLDFDDEQITRLQQIAAEFRSLSFTRPSGESNIPDSPPGSDGSTPPQLAPDSVPGGEPPSNKRTGDDLRDFLDRQSAAYRRNLSSLRAFNTELTATAAALGDLFNTAVKWGATLGAVAVAGPLGYGAISSRVSEQVRTAQGANISPGALQAANATYGTYFGDATSTLSALATAQYDPSNPLYAGLLAIGLDPRDNPDENYPALLERVEQIAATYQDEGVTLQYLNSLGLGSVVGADTVNQLVANREQLPQLREDYQAARARNDERLSPAVTGGYQAVTSSLSQNADDITDSFLRALSRLQGPITELSDELTDLITGFLEGPNGEAVFDSIAEGLQQLARWLGSDEFQNDLREFGEDLSAAARGLREFVSWLAEVFGQDPEELAAWGAGGAAALGILGAGGVAGAVRAGGRAAGGAVAATGGLLRFSPWTAAPLALLPNNDTPGTAGEFEAAGMRPWWEVNPPQFDADGNYITPGQQPLLPANLPEYGEDVPTGEGALTRGIRNNNPGNLRYAGQRGATSDEDGFAVFQEQRDGIAALDRQIDLYLQRGKDTLAEIIETYAPPNENRTDDYTRYVARETGIEADQQIDRNDVASVSKIIRAIIDYENGQQGQQVSDRDIVRAQTERRGPPIVAPRDPIEIGIVQQPGSDYRAQVQAQTGGN